MKNGYSISYSVIKPKENSSNLTSFLSQNSLRSNSTMKTIASRMCITPKIKQSGLASPRQKIITLHESRSPAHGRTKFISEHSNTPYLCISKKQHEIRIPSILPKLSPEPKIEISRMPYINIMTEPTAAIEEMSDDEKSNGDISPKSVYTPKDSSLKNSLAGSQNIINTSNNILQVSQDDQLSNSRASLKNRFKQAVQKSFRGIPRKSLFNVLISAEFNAFHEEERKSIHKKIEKGNIVLANKMIHMKRIDNQTKCLKDFSMKKRERFINMEQFTVSMKAFQRKINLIHGASSKNVFCLESFSLFSKNCRKSILSSNQKMLNEIIQPPSDEKQRQEKFNVTIELEGVELHRFSFSKPSFTQYISKKMDSSVNEDQHSAQTPNNKVHGNFSLFPTPQAPTKCIRQASSKKLEYLQSKRMTRQSILPQIEDMNSRLDLDSDYSKAKLFVRVYYQNKLYKLIQRTNYTKENLIEIEESFNPKIAQNSTIMTSLYTVMSTTDPGIRQRRITNEFLDKIQCVPIQLSKYSFSPEQINFEYDDESLSASNSSSGDSNTEGSFEKYLESPAYDRSRYSDKLQLEPLEQKKRKNTKKQKTIVISQGSPKESRPIFLNDNPTDNKQLSTGSLVLIKKIRKAFQMAIFLQPIISTLEQATKNQLLTFRTPPTIQEFVLTVERDQSQRAFEELKQFEKKSYLNKIIQQGIEIRYEVILMGRYECQTRMIDVEHQDPPQQVIYEKQDTKCEKIEPQLQQVIVSIKASNKNSNKDSVRKDSGAKKQQLINSKKQNQSQRHLTKQDSLQVTQPQWNRRAMLSGEISNVQTVQNSNQQNSNLFTQTSTVLITKPTQTSQQSVFRVMSSKHIDLNCSQQDLSSSFHSSQNDETPPQMNTLPQQQQLLTQPNANTDQGKIINNRHIHSHRENSIRIDDNRERSTHQYGHKAELSMYMFSLRMRTHIKESVRRQKLNQLEQIKLAIFDHNYTEFMDNIQLIPETQLDSLLSNGDSFLILAAQCGNLEIVKELLRRGAEINHQNVLYYLSRMMVILQCIQLWLMVIIRLQIFLQRQEVVLIQQIKMVRLLGPQYELIYQINNQMDREKKNKQLMNIYQYDQFISHRELTKQGSKLKDTNLFSLKHVLKELSKQKKTPSTSLHTTASKRNQQSQQSKTNQPLSPQTSYRSRLQLTKRNLWIDLINLHSQQYIQQDQIAITEYRTNTKIDSMIVADWKSPYCNLENQQNISNNYIQHQNIDNFHHWKDLLQKRLQQKKS